MLEKWFRKKYFNKNYCWPVEPDEGSILIDNIELKKNLQFDENSWLCSQEIGLIEGTLKENICSGVEKEKINKLKLDEAIVKSQLNEFIKKYGLNNNLGEYGQKISGGETKNSAC